MYNEITRPTIDYERIEKERENLHKAYEEVARCDTLSAFGRLCPDRDRHFNHQIMMLDKIIESAAVYDIPIDTVDAIEEARDALVDCYFSEAEEFAKKIEKSSHYQEFLKTWKPEIY